MSVILIEGERCQLLKRDKYPVWLCAVIGICSGANISLAGSLHPDRSYSQLLRRTEQVVMSNSPKRESSDGYWQQIIMCPLNSKMKLPSEKGGGPACLFHTVHRYRLPAYLATNVFSASLIVCSPASPSEGLKPLIKKSIALFVFSMQDNCSVW